MRFSAKITAIGSYVPVEKLDNHHFEKIINTNDEWIVSRTGIKERRRAREDEFCSDLVVKAAEDLKKRYPKTEFEDVDFILVATSTPDFVFPNTASILQDTLEIKRECGCLDISSACSGFAYAFFLADSMIQSKQCQKVLIVGAETLTKIIDYTDRATCMLFGDGAGIALVEADRNHPPNEFLFGTEGDKGKFLYCSKHNTHINGSEILTDGNIHQNGREVFKWAVNTVSDGIRKLLDKANAKIDEVDRIIPHSANMRILSSIAKNLKVPLECFSESIVYSGNTSAATIPLSITRALDQGELKKEDTVILYGFGGGLTHCGVLLKWDI